MLLYVLAIILGCNICICIIKRAYKAPAFLFSVIWCVVLFLYNLRLYNIYDIQLNTQIIVCSGVLSFLLGCFFIDKIFLFPSNAVSVNWDTKIQFNRFRLITFFVICILAIYYIPNIFKGIKYGSFAYMKYTIAQGDIGMGGPLVQFFARPFGKIIMAMATYCIFRCPKQKFMIGAGIIVMLLELLGGWSKSIVLTMFLWLMVAYVMLPHQKLKSYNNHFTEKLLQLVGLFGALISVVIFFVVNVGKGLYFYACVCFPILDQVVNSSFYLADGHTYSFLSFNSVYRVLFHILSPLNVHSNVFDVAENFLFKIETFIEVAPGKNNNAFHTMFGDFYMDFGTLGVMVLSFLFGMFSTYIFREYSKTPAIHWHVIYCLVVYYIIFSIVRFQLSQIWYGLPLIYACVLLKPLLYLRIKK